MKRRPFQSRWGRDANLLARVVTGVLPTPEGLLERQRLTELSAIECFAKGVATPDDFRVMCDVLNVAETMAHNGIGPEVLETCSKMECLMLVAKDDFEMKGVMRFGPMALRLARDLYEFHDLQRTAIDWQTYAKMIEKTASRIRSAHPDVKELT